MSISPKFGEYCIDHVDKTKAGTSRIDRINEEVQHILEEAEAVARWNKRPFYIV